MLFVVSRTSQFLTNTPPCDGCVKLENTKRILLGREEFDWGIEINTLDELLEFKEKVGEDLVLTECFRGPQQGAPEIEIYDGYRE